MVSMTSPIKGSKDLSTFPLSVFYLFQTLIEPYYQERIKPHLQLQGNHTLLGVCRFHFT